MEITNSISGFALSAFGVIIAGLVTLVASMFKTRVDAKEIKANAETTQTLAQEAANEAKQARQNTANVSNGFADGVGRKLDILIREQIKLRDRMETHMEWHINNPPQKESK